MGTESLNNLSKSTEPGIDSILCQVLHCFPNAHASLMLIAAEVGIYNIMCHNLMVALMFFGKHLQILYISVSFSEDDIKNGIL